MYRTGDRPDVDPPFFVLGHRRVIEERQAGAARTVTALRTNSRAVIAMRKSLRSALDPMLRPVSCSTFRIRFRSE